MVLFAHSSCFSLFFFSNETSDGRRASNLRHGNTFSSRDINPLLRNKGVQFRPADNAGTIHSSRGKIPSNVNAVDAFERLSRTRDRLTLAYATCSRSGRIFGACTLAE